MLPDSYKQLSCVGAARSFLDNRSVTERRRREFCGGGTFSSVIVVIRRLRNCTPFFAEQQHPGLFYNCGSSER